MKNFIYKGFGIDGEGTIGFKIMPTDGVNPVLVEIRTNDHFLLVDFGDHFGESYAWIWHRSTILYEGTDVDRYCDRVEELPDDGSFDDLPREWSRCHEDVAERCYFKNVTEAVFVIKKIVSERRDYWNERRKAYKKLSLEIREIKPQDLVIEGVEEIITLYEKKEKCK